MVNLDVHFCRGIEKSFCVAMCPIKRFFWTIHFSNRFDNDYVMPTIKGEYAAHGNCSQTYHTCLQRIVGFVDLLNFAMVEVDDFCK